MKVQEFELENLPATLSMEQIRLIYDRLGEEALPEELRALAALRLENPEASLRDLGEMMDPPLSRSGVNHRLKRIEAISRGIARGEEIE